MPNEIWHNFPDSDDLYAFIYRRTDDKVYDVVAGSNTFDTWADGDRGTYDLKLATKNGDRHSVDFPSGIAAGVYDVTIRKYQVVDTPALDDIDVAQGVMYWDGTAELNPFTLNTQIEDDVIGADGDSHEDLSDQLDGLTSSAFKHTNVYPMGE